MNGMTVPNKETAKRGETAGCDIRINNGECAHFGCAVLGQPLGGQGGGGGGGGAMAVL